MLVFNQDFKDPVGKLIKQGDTVSLSGQSVKLILKYDTSCREAYRVFTVYPF